MTNQFTAIIEKDGVWFVGYCPEVPGANGQGKTKKECKESLSAAISLILEDRRKDALNKAGMREGRKAGRPGGGRRQEKPLGVKRLAWNVERGA